MNILRLPEVRQRTGRSRSRIYADAQAGKFPKPINIGPRAIGWIQSEVDDWIAARIAEREAT
jgi:prophage regulatory protein